MRRSLSYTLQEHEITVENFVETVRAHCSIDLRSIVDAICESAVPFITNLSETNKILIDGEHVLLDFNTTSYFTNFANEIVPWKGTATDWLVDRKMLWVIHPSSTPVMTRYVESGNLRKALMLERSSSIKLTTSSSLKHIVVSMLVVYMNDYLAIGMPDQGLYYKCNIKGRDVTLGKYEDVPNLLMESIEFSEERNREVKTEIDFDFSWFFEANEHTHWLAAFHMRLDEIADAVGLGIVKFHVAGDFVTIFIGDDARALLWHQQEIIRLTQQEEANELRGNS